MICLDETWRFISGTGQGNLVEARVRSELLGCCMGCLLVHTNLRAAISEVTTASDASSTGGAVGQSKIEPAGRQLQTGAFRLSPVFLQTAPTHAEICWSVGADA